jgi:hypothetical protein
MGLLGLAYPFSLHSPSAKVRDENVILEKQLFFEFAFIGVH